LGAAKATRENAVEASPAAAAPMSLRRVDLN
jgi:hypothetical protein